VNNHLREHLLSIIDGEIDITTFGRHCISKDIDPKVMPNFPKFKQVLEKSKQYLKKVESSVDILQKSIRYFSSEEEKTQASFDKYDRFLR
jgi:penicillin V acylase-like amidase (Ntn superfamily)